MSKIDPVTSCTPSMDLATAGHKIQQLESKVQTLIEVVKLQQKRLERNDELNTWMWHSGYNYEYANTKGSIHKKKEEKIANSLDGRGVDTYYPDFTKLQIIRNTPAEIAKKLKLYRDPEEK